MRSQSAFTIASACDVGIWTFSSNKVSCYWIFYKSAYICNSIGTVEVAFRYFIVEVHHIIYIFNCTEMQFLIPSFVFLTRLINFPLCMHSLEKPTFWSLCILLISDFFMYIVWKRMNRQGGNTCGSSTMKKWVTEDRKNGFKAMETPSFLCKW